MHPPFAGMTAFSPYSHCKRLRTRARRPREVRQRKHLRSVPRRCRHTFPRIYFSRFLAERAMPERAMHETVLWQRSATNANRGPEVTEEGCCRRRRRRRCGCPSSRRGGYGRVAQSRLAGRPPTLLPTAKYRPPDGTFSHRFTIARSQSPFGTAQARSLFDEPTQDEPNGDAAADEAEQGKTPHLYNIRGCAGPSCGRPSHQVCKGKKTSTASSWYESLQHLCLLHRSTPESRQHGRRVVHAC